MKSLLFLCSSGWQGHNLFYDLLGRVAVLYSSLKDTFDNCSNETPALKKKKKKKKQDPALAFLQHQYSHGCANSKDTQLFPGGLCCFCGDPPAPKTARVMFKEPPNHAAGSLGRKETVRGWNPGGLGFTIKLV